MDAMLLAAGLGTRLRPLTDDTPKALIEVGGVPMLERIARRVIAAGADRLIINVHAMADRIAAFVDERRGFGVEVVLSYERDGPLETGGGLRHAARHFRRDRAFFVHNTDVLSDLSLEDLHASHMRTGALASLAVMPRDASRYFIFDEQGLCGHGHVASGTEVRVREGDAPVQRLPFCGVQVLSPGIFDLITETGEFSLVDVYLRLAAAGHTILPYRVDGAVWLDIGTPERLAAAEHAIADGRIT